MLRLLAGSGTARHRHCLVGGDGSDVRHAANWFLQDWICAFVCGCCSCRMHMCLQLPERRNAYIASCAVQHHVALIGAMTGMSRHAQACTGPGLLHAPCNCRTRRAPRTWSCQQCSALLLLQDWACAFTYSCPQPSAVKVMLCTVHSMIPCPCRTGRVPRMWSCWRCSTRGEACGSRSRSWPQQRCAGQWCQRAVMVHRRQCIALCSGGEMVETMAEARWAAVPMAALVAHGQYCTAAYA
jgi:hypothetical protein